MPTRFTPCPRSPNCVSSRADPSDRTHYVSPLRAGDDRDSAMERVAGVVRSMRGARIEAEEPGYLHAVFTSRLFRFKDDVELEWDDGDQLVHVRSASRVGYSDLGANRKRVEQIRRLLG